LHIPPAVAEKDLYGQFKTVILKVTHSGIILNSGKFTLYEALLLGKGSKENVHKSTDERSIIQYQSYIYKYRKTT